MAGYRLGATPESVAAHILRDLQNPRRTASGQSWALIHAARGSPPSSTRSCRPPEFLNKAGTDERAGSATGHTVGRRGQRGPRGTHRPANGMHRNQKQIASADLTRRAPKSVTRASVLTECATPARERRRARARARPKFCREHPSAPNRLETWAIKP